MKWSRWIQCLVLSIIAALCVMVAAPDRIPKFEASPPALAPHVNGSTQPSPMVSIPPPQVDADQLMSHVEALAFERYSKDDRQRTRDYLVEVLQSAGWVLQAQPYDTGVNLRAQRLGTEPKAGAILVAAHYDSVINSPGADDNASGVAAVLEVARLLGDRPTPRTLQIALFDQEEEGLVGSFAYVEQPANLENLTGVIVLEMLGYTCHTVGCQRQPNNFTVSPPTDLGDFITVVGDTEHLPLLKAFEHNHVTNRPPLLTLSVPLKGILTPIVLTSDHTPFWQKDVGAVMVTDTAFLRNPHYHRTSDTPETLDRSFFTAVTQMVVNTTTALLESRDSLVTGGNSSST